MVHFAKEKFYITTAIPYVNAPPHIGHALEFVQTDAIARFARLTGRDVFFLTGTDENAQKNVLSAEALGIPVKDLVDKNTAEFKHILKILQVSNDDFIRTTDKKKHWPGVEKLWNLCLKSGDIYKKTYSGLYCVGCEAFVTEKDLENGLCPEHQKPPEIVSEENYFFKLSKYQKRLEELIEADELEIIPESRKNEVLSFIRSGLEDFSVSRPTKRVKGWGVPVPGDDSQIVYVWYDALANYITALGLGTKDEKKVKKYWPADLHVIGKGIIRFHAVYWPAMLLSAGIELPKTIFVHGYITVEGQKMSKSLGNVINPKDLVERYGSDAVRYFMLREIPPFSDGDFSEKALVKRINTELVANYSNLYYRVTSFIERNFRGNVEDFDEFGDEEGEIEEFFKGKIEQYKNLMDNVRLNEALSLVLELSSRLNKYFQDRQPWATLKTDETECKRTIAFSVRMINIISTLFYPFIPSEAEEALENFNLKPSLDNIGARIKYRPDIKGIMLFKKVEEKNMEKKTKKEEVGLIPFKEFKKMEFRIGTVLEAAAIEKSEKLVKMDVDFGGFKRQVVAGIRPFYTPKELAGKQFVFITNLEHAKMMGYESEAMVLAAVEGDDENVVLLKPEKKVKDGTMIS
ncbi:methionine--tRNA ligase [Candidatus Micrarchaeota archaeon RBG_16_49_10]|nr:MAG: methionine--tRNA ligase [Candidatus Micrarchaeota archaeon RBG_16_49_10]